MFDLQLNESSKTLFFNRQIIILHNLANRVAFVFSLDIEHWQVKEDFLPWGHF